MVWNEIEINYLVQKANYIFNKIYNSKGVYVVYLLNRKSLKSVFDRPVSKKNRILKKGLLWKLREVYSP